MEGSGLSKLMHRSVVLTAMIFALGTALSNAQEEKQAVHTVVEIPMSALAIHGALISTANLAAQREIFEAIYGLVPIAEQSLDEAAVKALWGVVGRTAETVLLETPGTDVGVRLIQFNPIADITVRDLTVPMHANFLRVIDFYAPDFDAGRALVEQAGLKLNDGIAEYKEVAREICTVEISGILACRRHDRRQQEIHYGKTTTSQSYTCVQVEGGPCGRSR